MACQDHTIESTLEIQRSYQSLGGAVLPWGFCALPGCTHMAALEPIPHHTEKGWGLKSLPQVRGTSAGCQGRLLPVCPQVPTASLYLTSTMPRAST